MGKKVDVDALLAAMGAAYTHRVTNAPVRDYSRDKRVAHSEGYEFATQFLQAYAASMAELDEITMTVEADVFSFPEFEE